MNGSAAAIDESRLPRTNELVESLTGPMDYRLFAPADVRPPLRLSPAGNEAIGTVGAQVAQAIDEVEAWDAASARIIRPVFPRVPSRSRVGDFAALQRWEGVVLEAGPDRFIARLVDKTSSNADEEAEFRLDEISRSDLELVMPGAVFYWSIGYLDRPSGQRHRQSVITFRRLPAWTDRQLEDARKRAEKLGERFGEPT